MPRVYGQRMSHIGHNKFASSAGLNPRLKCLQNLNARKPTVSTVGGINKSDEFGRKKRGI